METGCDVILSIESTRFANDFRGVSSQNAEFVYGPGACEVGIYATSQLPPKTEVLLHYGASYSFFNKIREGADRGQCGASSTGYVYGPSEQLQEWNRHYEHEESEYRPDADAILDEYVYSPEF